MQQVDCARSIRGALHYAVRAIVSALLASIPAQSVSAAGTDIDLHALPKIATIDPRFQSFNVEMVEVTGGRFWAPYSSQAGERYAQRPPIDLKARRLRILAKGLSPAYMRVSGTWANSTYVPSIDETPPSKPPSGFKQVLTQSQWRDVVAFARENDLAIMTSFPVSDGSRGQDGRWLPDQALRLLSLTRSMGGRIAAAEFFNEPNLTKLGSLPEGYGAADYATDFATFRAFARRLAPEMLILGPGSSGEGGDVRPADMMQGVAGGVDAVSYHFYGALSQRCADFGNQTSPDQALVEGWLSRTEKDHDYYAGLRDRFEPGKPIWLTETAQAACGGSPWAATFRDTFRYVDQMGRLAKRGVKVIAHNTLAASEYALVDGATLEPRPSYWAALLWRRLMGTTVLQGPVISAPDVRIYAHCLRGNANGVAVLAENLGNSAQKLTLYGRVTAFVMTSSSLDSGSVAINGRPSAVGRDGALPRIHGEKVKGAISLPAHSISFLAVKNIGNPACVTATLTGD